MELAHLIIRVDGQGVEKANSSLGETSKEAAKAEKSLEKLENTFKRNSQSYIRMTQDRAARLDDMMKRQTQRFEMEESRKAVAAEMAQRRILAAAEQAAQRREAIEKSASDRADARMHREMQSFIAAEQKKQAARGSGSSGSRWALAPEVTLSNMAQTMGPFYTTVATAFAGRSMLNTIVEMETLQARLLSVTGSAEKANATFEKLKILDRQLPHDIAELTNAFTLLIHSGFEPSERALRSISALSSYSTEDVNDVVIAMQRATMGEFRNLKKYGVAAEAFGEQVRFTFNGMTEVVDRNSVAIQNYFMRLSEQGTFMNASKNKMDTLAGSISNLESAWKSFIDSGSENGGIGWLLKTLIDGLTHVLDGMDNVIGGMTRIGARFFESISWALHGDLDKATESLKEFGMYAAMPGLAAADYAEDKARLAAKADLSKLQSPAAIEAAKKAAHKSEMERVQGEMDARKELRDIKLRFESEEARLEAEGADEIAKIWNDARLSGEEKQKFHAKILEEHEAKLLKMREDSQNKIQAEIDRAKAKADKEDEQSKVVDFRSGLLGEEDAAMEAYRKREETIKSFTKISADERAELERMSWQKTEDALIEIASGRKDELKKIYDAEIKESERLYDINKINYEQHLAEMAAAEKKYRFGVANIYVGGGTRFTPLIKPGEVNKPQDASDLRKQYVGGRASIEQEYKDKSARLWADPEVDEKFEIQAAMDEEERNRIISFEEGNLSIKLSARQAEHEQELRMMRDLHDAGEISTETYHDRMREEARRYQADMAKIGESGNRLVLVQNLQMQAQVLGMAGNIAGQLDQLAQENSDAAKATFLAVKVISIAQALVNTHLGATQALALGPYGISMYTMILGMGYASAAIMAATSVQEYSGKFADGGFLGGNQTTGDRVLFHGNAGEAVLNGNQQRNFMALANGQGGGNQNAPIINIYNNASGTTATARTNEMGEIEVFIEELDKRGAANIMSGKSRVARALEKTHGLRRTGMAS